MVLPLPPEPSIEDAAWAAGFFDGEGSIRIVKQRRLRGNTRYWLEISASQIVPEPIDNLIHLFRGTRVYTEKRGPRQRPIYRWVLAGHRAVYALECMAPFLTTKRSQAIVGRHFYSLETPKRLLTSGELEERENLFRLLQDMKRETTNGEF